MNVERMYAKLNKEIKHSKILDISGQLLCWAADGYSNIARILRDEKNGRRLSVDEFSHRFVESICTLRNGADILSGIINYASAMRIRPPEYLNSLQEQSHWCLKEFIEGDFSHTVGKS